MNANRKCGRNTLLLSFAFSFHLPDTKITSGRLRPPALTRKKKEDNGKIIATYLRKGEKRSL